MIDKNAIVIEELQERNKMNHDNLCNSCLDDPASCKPERIIYGIDCDPSLAQHKDMDKQKVIKFKCNISCNIDHYFSVCDEGD